jgi:hypothetical protein
MLMTAVPLFLIVSARREDDRPWPAKAAGRATRIESYAHASNLAAINGHSLRIAHAAWQQMVSAGQAPHVVPADVELI